MMYAWLCKGRPGATRAGAGPGDLDDGWSEVEAAGGTNGLPLAGAGGLLLTSMHMTLLGALLVLAPRDIYADICGTAPDLSGQQIGGMLMLAIGTPVYLIAGLWLTGQALQERRQA